MNIAELLIKEGKNLEDYFYSFPPPAQYGFIGKNLTSLEGLPEDFNFDISFNANRIRNLKGLPKKFNSKIWLAFNELESLDGLNDILDPKNIEGPEWDFIVNEYIRLGKHHLLI